MKSLVSCFLSALIAASCLSTSSMAQAPAQQAKQLPLFQSPAYVAPNTSEQHFEGNLTLAPGQALLPMTLVVYNGAGGKVPFNWFRINLAGYLMASEKNIAAGKRQGAIDVSGRMQAGSSQIVIEAAGEPGATLSFSLFTTPISLEVVEPSNVMQGQAIILHGSNFSPTESQDTVLINGRPAQILSASATSITARVPADAQTGNNSVQVSVNGVSTRSMSVNVGSRPVPVLHSMNYWMAPPGAVLTIQGSNFAAAAADNKVFFKNVAAQVVSANPNRLQVIIPNWSYGPQEMNIPVWVIATGIRSGNYLPFDIGPKYQGALPPMPGDSSSEASSQASSQAGWPLQAGSESTSEANSEARWPVEAGSQSGNEQSSQSGSEAPGVMVYP